MKRKRGCGVLGIESFNLDAFPKEVWCHILSNYSIAFLKVLCKHNETCNFLFNTQTFQKLHVLKHVSWWNTYIYKAKWEKNLFPFITCFVEEKLHNDPEKTCINASDNGHVKVVELLLNDPRVDPSNYNNTAIRWASFEGRVKVVELLLNDPRVDPSANNNFAIRYASHKGYAKVVELLLNHPRVSSTWNE